MRKIVISSGLLILLFLGAFKATAATEEVDRYDIPAENLLMNTFAGEYVTFTYGGALASDANQIGLVFAGAEVAAAIPGFKAKTQGYIGPVDASPSVVVERVPDKSNFQSALVTNVQRATTSDKLTRYGQTNFFWDVGSRGMFDLLDEEGDWKRNDMLPPACMISETQDGGEYHTCLFSIRRNGFEYSFQLHGENLEYAELFVDFVRAKLDHWKMN